MVIIAVYGVERPGLDGALNGDGRVLDEGAACGALDVGEEDGVGAAGCGGEDVRHVDLAGCAQDEGLAGVGGAEVAQLGEGVFG